MGFDWCCLYGWFECVGSGKPNNLAGVVGLMRLVWFGRFNGFGLIGFACSIGSNALV